MSLASYRLFIFNFEHMLHNVLCVHCCLEQVNTGCAVKNCVAQQQWLIVIRKNASWLLIVYRYNLKGRIFKLYCRQFKPTVTFFRRKFKFYVSLAISYHIFIRGIFFFLLILKRSKMVISLAHIFQSYRFLNVFVVVLQSIAGKFMRDLQCSGKV